MPKRAWVGFVVVAVVVPPKLLWGDETTCKRNLDQGDFRCSTNCSGLAVSVQGQPVSGLKALDPCQLGGANSSLDEALRVRVKPAISHANDARLTDGALVLLDFDAPDYEPAHAYFKVGSGDEVRAVLAPVQNLSVTIQGPGAAASIFAEKAGEDVDRCQIDAAANEPTCSMHVRPEVGPDGTPVTVRIVGTANTSIQTCVFSRVMTEVKIAAPRAHFPWYGDLVVGATLAVGLGISAPMAVSGGANGGQIGWDVGAALLAAATLTGAYFEVVGFGMRTFPIDLRYVPQEGVTLGSPPCRSDVFGWPRGSIGGLPPHPPVAVGASPTGLVVRW
jgi:hypothetical protein